MSIAFGDCVLDLETRELCRGGAVVHLQPKAYRLLEVLIERRPRVVTRRELDELLWPETYVARSSLGRLVTELREALGDDAQEPRLVRTVHTVGYAFCAEIAPAGGAQPERTLVTLLWGDRRFALHDGEHLLGRALDCGICIDETGVSRSHARVTVTGAGATLVDLGSKNGTWVNRRRISSPTPLRAADEITVGTAVLTVALGDGDKTTKTVFVR